MRKVCSMCKANLGSVASNVHADDVVTHCYCENCLNALLNELAVPLKSFVDRIPDPILVVDEDGVALTANEKALKILGKDIKEIIGFTGGNVIECIHSQEPGGCGKTIHCVGCAIRNTVTDTFKTGKSHLKEPAYADILVKGAGEKVRFLISTQKVKNVVWLRIDEVGGSG